MIAMTTNNSISVKPTLNLGDRFAELEAMFLMRNLGEKEGRYANFTDTE